MARSSAAYGAGRHLLVQELERLTSCPCSAPADNRVSARTVPILGRSRTWVRRVAGTPMKVRGYTPPRSRLIPAEWKDNDMPINFDYHKVELNWGGQPSPSRPARSPARLTAPCSLRSARDRGPPPSFPPVAEAGSGLFPTVNYQESARRGKILAATSAKGVRPSRDVRASDRPIRPLFLPDGWRKNETRSSSPFCSTTAENNPDVFRWSRPPPR